jgi:cation diffusion facilitator CzcD-associated flavoprotein CzcO
LIGSAEIKTYFTSFCKRFQLDNYIKTSHLVNYARWHEAAGEWEVTVFNSLDGEQFTERCDILICATGYLNNWKWPDIRDTEKYKGTLLHSANWESEVNLDGKTIALIGNG